MITTAKHLTIRIKPSTKTRLDAMAHSTKACSSAESKKSIKQLNKA